MQCIYVTIPANTRYNLIIGWFTVEEISHKRIFSWDVHLESKYVSHKRIRFCEQSVYAESPLDIWYVGSGVILGWYKGPIFEILKWWQTDKQTNRFSTCRLDPRKKSSENTTGGATGQTQYWSHVFEKSFPPQIYKTQENITNSLFGQKNQI